MLRQKLGMLKQKRGKFNIFLSYTVNSKPDWTTYRNHVSKLKPTLSEKKIYTEYTNPSVDKYKSGKFSI